MAEQAQKSYDELGFTDDFLFGKIMTTHLDLAKELLELILDIRIKELRLAQSQKSEKFTPLDRGVRYDVYVEDSENTVYDIEMQTSAEENIGKRMRYYQGMIDLDTLQTGAPFGSLKKSYVIFLCTKKPAKLSPVLPLYTFSSVCREDPAVELGDETFKVIVNADCDFTGENRKLGHFLSYLRAQTVQDDFTSALSDAVRTAKTAVEWRMEYMTMLRKLQEAGFNADRRRLQATVIKMYQLGLSMPIIAASNDISEEEAKAILEKNGYYQS